MLLDEIDRADASIQDILLSILEGQGKDAEGEPVAFSQAVFILTANQGQDRVEAAYEESMEREESRQLLAEKLDDRLLRQLVLEGVVDQAEANLRDGLEALARKAKEPFETSGQLDGKGLDHVEHYLALRELLDRLRRDRAQNATRSGTARPDRPRRAVLPDPRAGRARPDRQTEAGSARVGRLPGAGASGDPGRDDPAEALDPLRRNLDHRAACQTGPRDRPQTGDLQCRWMTLGASSGPG